LRPGENLEASSSVALGGNRVFRSPAGDFFPKQEKYLPSPVRFAWRWIFQWYYGFLLFFMGAVIRLVVSQKKSPAQGGGNSRFPSRPVLWPAGRLLIGVRSFSGRTGPRDCCGKFLRPLKKN